MAARLIFLTLSVIFGFTGAQYVNQGYQQYPPSNPSQTSYGNNQNYGTGQQGTGSWNQQQQQQQQQGPYTQQVVDPYAGRQLQTSGSGVYSPQGAGYGVIPQTSAARPGTPLRFCTVTNEEQSHCLKMVYDLAQPNVNVRSMNVRSVPEGRQKRQTSRVRFNFQCVQAVDKLECMKWIGMDKSVARADLVLATPGEAFVGGKEYGLIPIAYEEIGPDRADYEDQVVAVVRADRNIDSINALRGKNACFGPVGDATWDHILAFLRTSGLVTAPRCEENYMDAVSRFFTDMCAPYDTRNFTDTENDRYKKLCSLCGGQNCPNLQSIQSDYPINCLVQNNRADVAFMKASVLKQALSSNTLPEPYLYQVLCPQSSNGANVPLVYQVQNGQTRSIQEWSECYIGRTPSNAYLTRANADNILDIGDRLQEIFYNGGSVNTQGGQSQRHQWLDNFFIGRYNDNQRVVRISHAHSLQEASIDNYLAGYTAYMEDKVSCSTQERARWCTVSKSEQEKCEMMKKAFKAYRLRPELECEVPVRNTMICLDKLNQNRTDLALIDIGDLVTGSSYYNVIQLAQERYLVRDQYSGSTEPIDEPYSVAVVKDAGINQLSALRGKRACFTGLWEAHGFMLPLQQLKQAGLIDSSSCGHLEQAQEFFGDSCLPGLADGELNFRNVPKDKLCRQCENGEQGCTRGSDKKYTGAMGALRCLRDGKGDVAFVPHTVLSEIPQLEKQNYYLVCNGIAMAQPLDSVATCNLGRAPGNVLVTNKYKGLQEKRRLMDMITTASRLFSADLAAQYQSNLRSSAASFSSTGLERSRKTYNMFGKRNTTDSSAYGSTYPSSQYGGGNLQPNLNPSYPTTFGVMSTTSSLSDGGEYALFGVAAYDLRGFGDINSTFPGQALQSFITVGERSDWKRCYEVGSGSRLSSLGAIVFLFLVSRVFVL